MWLDDWDGEETLLPDDNDHRVEGPPTRSAVQGALLAVTDMLLDVEGIGEDMTTKLRAMKNYVDTMFDQSDYMRLKAILCESPDLVDALHREDLTAALAQLEAQKEGGASLQKALSYARDMDARLAADVRMAMWAEVQVVCGLAHG